MQPAQEEVARVLGGLAMHDPRIPVAANVSGGMVTTAAAARDALTRQVTGTVRWVECVQSLAGRSLSAEDHVAPADVFVEAGPGKVLCGLLRQIDPALRSMNVEDAASLENALAEL
jgi:[acyl-carrier-protein] S-malonyltransferase